MIPAAFAIPGDPNTLTGGFVYERRLLEELRAQGREVAHIRLPGSFPDPPPADAAAAADALATVPPERALILDGFLSGALDPDLFARIRAPTIPVVHHPLALEDGLAPERAARLFAVERANLARVAHIVVPSPHTRAMLVDRYDVAADKITVARPGVDRPYGTSAPVDPPLILSVGILHPRKGHDVLIEALARIRDLDWQAVIVGAAWDAEHAADLAGRAAATGLGDRLTLAGRVEIPRLHRLYRAATLFALATRYEGYGIVFDEALAAGLPIVACKVGAVPDTVPAAAGRLVAADDAGAMADALRRVLTDARLRGRLAAGAAAAGRDLPGWQATAATVGAILDRVAG